MWHWQRATIRCRNKQLSVKLKIWSWILPWCWGVMVKLLCTAVVFASDRIARLSDETADQKRLESSLAWVRNETIFLVQSMVTGSVLALSSLWHDAEPGLGVGFLCTPKYSETCCHHQVSRRPSKRPVYLCGNKQNWIENLFDCHFGS